MTRDAVKGREFVAKHGIPRLHETVEALVADRRGDVLMAQGKQDAARTAWQTAWKAMDDKLDYRRLIDAKLTAAGAAPDVPAGATAASGAAR